MVRTGSLILWACARFSIDSMKKPKKPICLLTAKRLRLEYGLSWHRIRRACDLGQLVPFAVNGFAANDYLFFHPDQLEELKATCANRPQGRWKKQNTSQGKADCGGG